MYVKKYGSRSTGSYRKSYRKKTGSTGKNRRYRRRTGSLPTRLRSSRLNYTINKKIGKMLNRFSETKLIACNNFNETAPQPIQTGAQAYFIAYSMGLTTDVTGGQVLDGIRLSQGTQGNERVGDYVYLKKTHLTMKLEMTNSNTVTPTQFRILVVKLRRYNSVAGTTSQIETSLFLNPGGAQIGHATPGVTGLDLMMQPTNKRNWVIYRDFKCTLQNYNQLSTTTAIYNNYPCHKDFQLNLPYFKKTKIGTAGLPIDMDYRYTVIIYAHNVSRETIANDFECTVRGTTSFVDN